MAVLHTAGLRVGHAGRMPEGSGLTKLGAPESMFDSLAIGETLKTALCTVALATVLALTACAGSGTAAPLATSTPEPVASTASPSPTAKFTVSAETICAQLVGFKTSIGPLEEYLRILYSSLTSELTEEDKAKGRAARTEVLDIATRADPGLQSTIEAVFSDESNEHKAALIEITHQCDSFSFTDTIKQP